LQRSHVVVRVEQQPLDTSGVVASKQELLAGGTLICPNLLLGEVFRSPQC
jgi:hypothetical protein